MATSIQTPPRHAVARAVVALHDRLDQVADASTWSMDPEESAATLLAATRLVARVTELQLRVAAHADDIGLGVAAGATSTGPWWAQTTRQDRPVAIGQLRFATALAEAHEPVRVALAAGQLLVEQARVIVAAVEWLPADLDRSLVERAEAHLIEVAAHHDPRALRLLGRRLFEVIAPEQADAHEARLLEQEERDAAAALRLTLSEDGHGHIRGTFTLDTLTGAMLKKALLAHAAPRHTAATHGPLDEQPGERPGERRPGPERMGRAFAEYIAGYPVDRLPHAGGIAATVVVTMDHQALIGGLKAAHLDTGEHLSASLARRLACEAGIIPAVLGTDSVVLDLGRKTRFHTEPMRIAMAIRDHGCTVVGCDWPPGLCHAHHDPPWSHGAGTSTHHGRLLYPRHHTRAHDPTYTTTKHPDGKITLTRRT